MGKFQHHDKKKKDKYENRKFSVPDTDFYLIGTKNSRFSAKFQLKFLINEFF